MTGYDIPSILTLFSARSTTIEIKNLFFFFSVLVYCAKTLKSMLHIMNCEVGLGDVVDRVGCESALVLPGVNGLAVGGIS